MAKKTKDVEKEDREIIENKSLDNNPPGSASANQRGVPTRIPNENRAGVSTSAPTTTRVSDSVEKPEIEPKVVRTMPFVPSNPLAEIRKDLRSQMFSNSATNDDKSKKLRRSSSGEDKKLSPRAIAHMIRTIDGADKQTAEELNSVLESMDVTPEVKEQVRLLMTNQSLFMGDQKPGNLNVLALPPGAQKPPEFEAAPGTTTIPDSRYYPSRFVMIPDDDDYESGDLIYSVHEDNSYTVLSVFQQSRQWQSTNHLPPMNLIRRVGGSVEEIPEELREMNMMDRNEIADDYDAETAEAK